jgi:dolichol-phosphate mannosyltransferase
MICAAMLAICLPTYNERENLEPMVRALGEVLAGAGLDARVLVIDDNSPDGTGELADRLAAELPWLEVLHRERKEGLGPAYLAGFRRVLAGDAGLVLEMDCDFSHDPADVPRLVAALENADLAIGSRYVKGGQVRNWGRIRRAVSRGGCLYAQAILGFGVRDPTAGFRCFRREVLETIALDRIRSKGYAFQIETTYRATRAGFRVVEIPITFADRAEGRSKMSRRIVLEAVWKVPLLRLAALLGRL